MKKLVSLLLAMAMCLSFGMMFTACDNHEHTYKTEWATDATYHWHECEGENCLDVADKAEHTWDDGKITTEATSDATGEKTFTCTVCNATKGESVKFEGVSEEKWEESLSEQKFDNVTINYELNNEMMEQTHVVKIADDKVYRSGTVTMEGMDAPEDMSVVYEGDNAAMQKKMFLDVFLGLLAERDNFVYDAEKKAYINPKDVSVTVEANEGYHAVETMKKGEVKFNANGLIELFSCELTETVYFNDELVRSTTTNATWTFSGYGTTVITESATE